MRNQIVNATGMELKTKSGRPAPKRVRLLKGLAPLSLLGLMLLILQLTGCASVPLDEGKYNPTTGYPAVGDRPWHS